MKRLAWPLGVALCLAGCSTGGVLEVHWSFGGKPCAAAGVTRVRLELTDVPPRTLPCRRWNGREEGSLEDVPEGVHTLRAEGLDAAGKVRFEALHEGLYFVKGLTTGVKIDLPPGGGRPR